MHLLPVGQDDVGRLQRVARDLEVEGTGRINCCVGWRAKIQRHGVSPSLAATGGNGDLGDTAWRRLAAAKR